MTTPHEVVTEAIFMQDPEKEMTPRELAKVAIEALRKDAELRWEESAKSKLPSVLTTKEIIDAILGPEEK